MASAQGPPEKPPSPDRDPYEITFLPDDPAVDLQFELKLLWSQASTLERGISYVTYHG